MTVKAKNIALVAHDQTKAELVEWVAVNEAALQPHKLWATGTTGRIITERCPSLEITLLKSGPLGGDQQLGAMIAEGKLDVLLFFMDPMTSLPHDVDVKALTRLSTLYNVIFACNRSSADFVISSPHFKGDYQRTQRDISDYVQRPV
ncbi:methylglyoxal synthase [Denitrobaculum tricleocarpae]|uniref:Methylglyoxal synthase n=1 Tax=Denitrobaculum tricleocarpae TaxID=2591009 RepID=A0A545TS34_9PROT|nr:methylglyoxal synthase [Denitrobaculum tricleocarpae]